VSGAGRRHLDSASPHVTSLTVVMKGKFSYTDQKHYLCFCTRL